MFALDVRAQTEDVVEACDHTLAPALYGPDPRLVDPQDVDRILAFLRNAGMPSTKTPYALRTGFERLLRRYRPDYSDVLITKKIDAMGFAQWSLRKLGIAEPYEIDIRRLRKAWENFLFDVYPHLRIAAWAAHRERALRVPMDKQAIVDFVFRETPEVPVSADRLRHGFERLYAEHLPQLRPTVTVEDYDQRGGRTRTVDQRVLFAWQRYVLDLTGRTMAVPAIPVPTPEPQPLKTKVVAYVPLTRAEVPPEDAASIIAYLANRYRHIRLGEGAAIRKYFEAFRAEHGLPARKFSLRVEDVRNAYYRGRPEAEANVRKAWLSCVIELEALYPPPPDHPR